MRTGRPHLWLLVLLAASTLGSDASAQDAGRVSQELADLEAATQQLLADPLRRRDLRSKTYVEERLTDGELFYRLQDYVRASIIFTDIVDNHSNHRAAPDALFLLGESLFRAGDYLGSRTRLRELINRADTPGYRPYVSRALGRLIEIAIHTRDFEGVEQYFESLSRLPPREVEAATSYYRAKYLYNRAVPTEEVLRDGAEGSQGVDLATLDQARQAFEGVAESSPFFPQARYFVGVILTLQRQFPQAIEAFRRVLRSAATTPEQQRVVELTQLALGRLYYETDQLDQAVGTYQAVNKTSVDFDVALYEVAWVYIRMGDSTRAEQALELLAVAAPDSRYLADAQILRGNLLLRNGRLERAKEVFDESVGAYGPVRDKLDAIVADHANPVDYFRGLVRENAEVFDANTLLPPEAIQYASDEADMGRALRVLSDLAQARSLVKGAWEIIQRLDAALKASNRVNVFADLRRQRQRTVSLRNRSASLRRKLIAIEARNAPSGDSELSEVRAQRRKLEEALRGMPKDSKDFSSRDEELLGGFRGLKRDLSELEVQLLGMDARIVATERFLEDTIDERENPQGAEAMHAELSAQRRAVALYREEIAEYRTMIEAGRIQVGVGDARYQRDARLREEYNELVERERSLMARAGIRRDPQLESMFTRVGSVEQQLQRRDAQIDGVVDERTAELRKALDAETTNVQGYRERLAELEQETEEVVGGVTYASFASVRHRFYDLVLRADVGKIDVSWAQREEHRMRVELLTRERAREIRALDDEFREIMDKPKGGE